MFSGRLSVRASVRDSRGSFMFPRYLQYLLTDFRQTFVTGASWDRDDLITFLGQKVKVQGHAIVAEAHSTRRYLRVQLFLVFSYFVATLNFVIVYSAMSVVEYWLNFAVYLLTILTHQSCHIIPHGVIRYVV